MRIVIENIKPTELFKLMEELIKPSDIEFGNREELIRKWDEYKKDVIKKGKESEVI